MPLKMPKGPALRHFQFMFRVSLSSVLRRRFASMASPSQTPVEDIIRTKVLSHSALRAFNPAHARVGYRSFEAYST
jgi:hypothetical protein